MNASLDFGGLFSSLPEQYILPVLQYIFIVALVVAIVAKPVPTLIEELSKIILAFLSLIKDAMVKVLYEPLVSRRIVGDEFQKEVNKHRLKHLLDQRDIDRGNALSFQKNIFSFVELTSGLLSDLRQISLTATNSFELPNDTQSRFITLMKLLEDLRHSSCSSRKLIGYEKRIIRIMHKWDKGLAPLLFEFYHSDMSFRVKKSNISTFKGILIKVAALLVKIAPYLLLALLTVIASFLFFFEE